MEREDTISLQDYLAVLRRQRWVVLLVTVLVVVAALGVSLAQTPLYESETEVVLEPVRRTQDISLEELLLPQGDVVQTERLVVTSRPVAERVATALGLDDANAALAGVRVETVADTRVVRIVAEHPDPAAAAERADAFADSYLAFRRAEAVDNLLAAQQDLEDRAVDVRQEIDALAGERNVLQDAQRDALIAQLGQIASQQAELGDASATVAGGGSILTPAEITTSPVSPQPVRTGALAVVLGLLLGFGLAFLRDHVDDVVRDESDVKRATGNRPIVGRIPTWNDPEGGTRLATVVEPSSIAAEAYRELSAGVRFMLLAHDTPVAGGAPGAAGAVPGAAGAVPGVAGAVPGAAGAGPGASGAVPGASAEAAPQVGRSIIVCSAAAGDGKTSTAANLAVSAARVGLRTLLVDADLRRSTAASRFGVGRSAGLSDLLLDRGQLHEFALDVGIDNLRVLSAGSTPPNPTELLASPAMRALERQILTQVDLVIYDTPAVLAVPDALELGRHVDFAILVGRAGTTGRRQLQSAIERLTQVGTEVTGTVLNDIDGRADGYYYAYYYADDATPAASAGDGSTRRERRAVAKAAKRDAEREAKAAKRAAKGKAPKGKAPKGDAPASRDGDGRRDDTDEIPASPSYGVTVHPTPPPVPPATSAPATAASG